LERNKKGEKKMTAYGKKYYIVIQINPFSSAKIIFIFPQDFMDSCGAASFFIRLRYFPNADNVQSDSLDNNKTSERLVITGTDHPFGYVTIARHPMQATEEWIEEMGKYLGFEYRYIYVDI
jgi:hypothetical protein